MQPMVLCPYTRGADDLGTLTLNHQLNCKVHLFAVDVAVAVHRTVSLRKDGVRRPGTALLLFRVQSVELQVLPQCPFCIVPWLFCILLVISFPFLYEHSVLLLELLSTFVQGCEISLHWTCRGALSLSQNGYYWNRKERMTWGAWVRSGLYLIPFSWGLSMVLCTLIFQVQIFLYPSEPCHPISLVLHLIGFSKPLKLTWRHQWSLL
mmetsp:Transcript_15656/g.22078  ORF Transcript_15656/g.22078 Transcript_15656/m.22078 type:complete len:207 (-) Transcript_15656:424-1044(-)